MTPDVITVAELAALSDEEFRGLFPAGNILVAVVVGLFQSPLGDACGEEGGEAAQTLRKKRTTSAQHHP